MAIVSKSHRVDSERERKASSVLSDSSLYGLSMEGRQSKTRGQPAPLTKKDLIIEAWDLLGRAAIGEVELREIQGSIRGHLGHHADESPAAIARILADEGAELRHPEVIEFDARWREAKIESENGQFKGVDELIAGKPLRLKKAEALIRKLEKLRQGSERSGDRIASKHIRDIAVNGRQVAESLAKDRTLKETQRGEQAEIAEWLKLWIQTPSLFADWLELRQRSPDFQKKFG